MIPIVAISNLITACVAAIITILIAWSYVKRKEPLVGQFLLFFVFLTLYFVLLSFPGIFSSDAYRIGAILSVTSLVLYFATAFFLAITSHMVLGRSRFYEPMQMLYNIGVIPFVYWLFRITAIPKDGDFEAKIKPALDVLSQNKVVVIFPEGGRILADKIGDSRRRATEIAIRTKAPVLPVVR